MKRIISILLTTVSILLICALSLSAFAATHTCYSDNTDDPTFRVRASLQGEIFPNTQRFRRCFATTRFDAVTTSPIYTKLILSATIEGTGLGYNPSVSFEREIGDYVTTGNIYMPEENGVFYLFGRHTARVDGSLVFFNPPDTLIQANLPD